MSPQLDLRSVWIHPEWQTGPLWITTNHEDFEGNATPGFLSEEFGLSAPLASDIDEWDKEFQRIYRPEDPLSSSFPDDETERRWHERGRQLATRLAEEYGSGVRVTYFDEVVQQGAESSEQHDH